MPISSMFCRPEKLPYLAGLPALQQYQVLLKVHGMQPHHRNSANGPRVLDERAVTIECFMQSITDSHGHLVAPLNLTPDDFSEVIKSWYANGISEKEFASRAKVAAWLFDLVISDFISPYPSRKDNA